MADGEPPPPPPPPPERPPPLRPDYHKVLTDEAGARCSTDLRGCDAIVMFEFTHTADLRPGPVNRCLAHAALRLWHTELGQRRGVPIVAPLRVLRALRDAERAWPCGAARRPRLLDLHPADEYGRLVRSGRASDTECYARGVVAAVCRALLRAGISPSGALLVVVTHHAHAPRWACLLEATLGCSVLLPPPKLPADFGLWRLDEEGYWPSEGNPQPWTRSARAFGEYEHARLQAFEQAGASIGPLFRARSWLWPFPPPLHAGALVWALYKGGWRLARVAPELPSDEGRRPKLEGVPVEWLEKSAALGGLAWTRARWGWHPANLEALCESQQALLQAPGAKCGGAAAVRGAQQLQRLQPELEPAPRGQRCCGCGFLVTGVLPQWCCHTCKNSHGRHGPQCRRQPWRKMHHVRSMSA